MVQAVRSVLTFEISIERKKVIFPFEICILDYFKIKKEVEKQK